MVCQGCCNSTNVCNLNTPCDIAVNHNTSIKNDAIHKISSSTGHQLSIHMEDFDSNFVYANYSNFLIGDEMENYQLTVYGFSGSPGVGDSMIFTNHNSFTTKDRDYDPDPYMNCAQFRLGAWWYNLCGYSNLNGQYLAGLTTNYTSAHWSNEIYIEYRLDQQFELFINKIVISKCYLYQQIPVVDLDLHAILIPLHVLEQAEADCDAQSDKGIKNEVVEITFSKNKCSISCHIDKDKAKTIYFMKLLKQTNGLFYDVLHSRRIGESFKTTLFNCTDMQSRSSHKGPDLDEATLVFELDSNHLLDTDNSLYKCEIDSESYTGIQWNTANIDWAGCVDKHDTNFATTAAVLTPIAYILFLKDNVEDCKCLIQKQVQPVNTIEIIGMQGQSTVKQNDERRVWIPPTSPGLGQTITIIYIEGGIIIEKDEDERVKIGASVKQVKLKQTTLSIRTKSGKDEEHNSEVMASTLVQVESTQSIF
ncbi:unnamed protein product [Mytilus edulis]|uniref:Fibrinogen C-terminal domain-containing protein n=1 Tax=Mytilus edulis TaxID=6550 RepID=A0A8S3QUF6_MYTED|nr:unnamed protein product [Mytilus edulis]